MGVEIVEILGGDPQLQDRNLALAVGGAGSQEAVTAVPDVRPRLSAISPALSLHSTSPAKLSSGNRLATEADHGQSANRKAPVPRQADHVTWPRRHRMDDLRVLPRRARVVANGAESAGRVRIGPRARPDTCVGECRTANDHSHPRISMHKGNARNSADPCVAAVM